MTALWKCPELQTSPAREASGPFTQIQVRVSVFGQRKLISSSYIYLYLSHFKEWFSRNDFAPILMFELGNMFENGCYLRRQKRFKIPKTEKDPSGHKSRHGKDGSLRGRGSNGNHSSSELSSAGEPHDIKKPSLKSGELFSGGLPPLTGPGASVGEEGEPGLTSTKVEKHDYKYNISDKYGVDPTDGLGGVGAEHLVLPAAPLGKPLADHYNPETGLAGDDKYDKYQTPDMSHLHSNLDHLHSRYSLSEGLLSLRPPPDSAYPTSNPFSIHRLLPGPGSPMHSSLSKSDLQYGDYGLQHHGLHHESMYYNPPVYQVTQSHLMSTP